MIIYLYGPDSYGRSKKAREIISAYKKKNPNGDLMFIDFEDDDGGFLKIKDFLGQISMFADSKLVVIRNCAEVDEKQEKEWIKFLKTYLEDKKAFLLISDSKKPKKPYQFLLEKPVGSQEFEELDGVNLEKFLKKEIEERKIKFEADAYKYFLKYLLSSKERSWQAVNDLDRIALFLRDEILNLTGLGGLIKYKDTSNIFFVVGGILSGRDIGARLKSLEKLLIRGEEQAYLFNLLGFQSKGEGAVKLADYDISIKSGKLDYEEALLDLAIS